MTSAVDEDARLRALRDLRVLDTPPEERFDRVVRLAQRLFDVPMAAVTLIDEDRQWLKSNVGMGDLRQCAREDAFCNETIRHDGPFVIPDTTQHQRYRSNPFVVEDPAIRFYAGQPLTAPGGQHVGALCILDDKPRDISESELDLLRDLANWVEKEMAIDEELVRASEVQRNLLPRRAPVVPGYEVAGICVPAREVGGDFFDYYTIGDELHLTIADVMGKGIGAAIIAASVRAVLRGASRFNDLVSTVNRSAEALELDLADTSTFATLFTARLRPDESKLSYVDAGHGLAAVVDASGHPRQLSSDDLPLGVLPDTRWSLHETSLEPGETFVTVSDGLLDYFDTPMAAAEATARLVAHADSAEEAVQHIGLLCAGRAVTDDVTALAVRKTA